MQPGDPVDPPPGWRHPQWASFLPPEGPWGDGWNGVYDPLYGIVCQDGVWVSARPWRAAGQFILGGVGLENREAE